jgi:hypothetical protein
MEAASSSQTSINTGLHGAIFQTTAILISVNCVFHRKEYSDNIRKQITVTI